MVRAFVILTLSILPAFALAGSCDAHTPDEGSMAVQLMGARSLIDSLDDVRRPGAGEIFGQGVSKTSCPKTLAPTAGQSKFQDYNASAQKCLGNNVAYIKVPKTGSSTMAGIFRRIAARNGLYGVDVFQTCASKCNKKVTMPSQEPAVCANHIQRFKFLQRSKFLSPLPTMLFATVREPLDHALSSLAYLSYLASKPNHPVPCKDKIMHGSVAPNMDRDSVIGQLQFASTSQYPYLAKVNTKEELKKFKVQGISVDKWGWSLNDTNAFLLTNATDLLAEFQVVGQTDRIAEAALLVAFSLKLNTLGDVLFICSKCLEQKGGTTHSFSALPESARDWMRGNEYKHVVKRDQELYDAAGRKMDMQIGMVDDALKHLGQTETFRQIVGRYKNHLRTAASLCATVELQDCYWGDNGCNWPCLDMYSTNHSIQLALPVI